MVLVKFSTNAQDGKSFYNIPRTCDEAEAGTGDDVWVRVEDANYNQPYFVYCQPNNERFCPVYDLHGFVAGVQVGVSMLLDGHVALCALLNIWLKIMSRRAILTPRNLNSGLPLVYCSHPLKITGETLKGGSKVSELKHRHILLNNLKLY